MEEYSHSSRARGVPGRGLPADQAASSSATASSRPRRRSTTRPGSPSASPPSTSSRAAGRSSAPARRARRPSSAGFMIDPAHKRAMWEEGLRVARALHDRDPLHRPHRRLGHHAAPQRGAQAPAEAPPADLGRLQPPRHHPPGRPEGDRRAHLRLHRPRGGHSTGSSDYYTTFEDECVPIGDAVNPNVACVTTFMCAETEDEAIAPRHRGRQLLRLLARPLLPLRPAPAGHDRRLGRVRGAPGRAGLRPRGGAAGGGQPRTARGQGRRAGGGRPARGGRHARPAPRVPPPLRGVRRRPGDLRAPRPARTATRTSWRAWSSSAARCCPSSPSATSSASRRRRPAWRRSSSRSWRGNPPSDHPPLPSPDYSFPAMPRAAADRAGGRRVPGRHRGAGQPAGGRGAAPDAGRPRRGRPALTAGLSGAARPAVPQGS